MNTVLFSELKYLKKSDDFHQWEDSANITWGLRFQSKSIADEFADTIADAIEQAGLGPLPAETAIDMKLKQQKSDKSGESKPAWMQHRLKAQKTVC